MGSAGAPGRLGGSTSAGGRVTAARCERNGFGASCTAFTGSTGDGLSGTPVARASAGSAGGVAGAVAGGAATTAAGATVCGWNATFMITAPPKAPATNRIPTCSGFIPSIPHNS